MIRVTDWLRLKNMVVYLYWSKGGGELPEGLNLSPVAGISEIALSKVYLLHYVRRTMLILRGETTTRGILESKRPKTHMPLQF